MKNLFIVHTPYNLILSIGIILKYNFTENDILFATEHTIENSFFIRYDNLNNIFDNIYNDFYLSSSIINRISNLIKIKRTINNAYYDRIFIFNDSILESQYIINKLKLFSKVMYVEDGSIIYLENYNKQSKFDILYKFKFYLKHILFGYDFKLKYGNGVSPRISEKMVLWPDLVVDDFKDDGKPIIEIKREVLISAIKTLYKDFIVRINSEIDYNKKNIIITLEHIDFFKRNKDKVIENYFNLFDYLIKNTSKYFNIYIKYHPRDNSNYMDKVFKNYNVYNIENNIPIEVFYTLDNIYIISVTSTALFTAAKIMNKQSVISICKILGVGDSNLIEKFLLMGIIIPNTKEKLLDYLLNNNIKL